MNSWFTDRVRPIAGFPGVGKTTAAKVFNYSDSDSTQFSRWKNQRHPDWPGNYIRHIQDLSGIVFISTHPEVRSALVKEQIPYLLVYPERDCKAVYLERFKNRGSPEAFITLLDDFWDEWITALDEDSYAFARIVLQSTDYVSEVINKLQI